MGTDGHGCAWTYGQSPSTSYVSRQNVTHGYKMLQNELILLQSNHRELKSKYNDLQSKYSDLQSKYLDCNLVMVSSNWWHASQVWSTMFIFTAVFQLLWW